MPVSSTPWAGMALKIAIEMMSATSLTCLSVSPPGTPPRRLPTGVRGDWLHPHRHLPQVITVQSHGSSECYVATYHAIHSYDLQHAETNLEFTPGFHFNVSFIYSLSIFEGSIFNMWQNLI